MTLEFAAIAYRAVRDRIRSEDPQIDEQTLADTVEGLTDLHEILTAIIRAALADEALATGLKGRIAEMEDRLARLQDRAAKRRQIGKDVMVELDLKKLMAPDFTASIRPGMPSLLVIDEAAVPSIYWEPRDPRLNRQGLLADLKQGAEITGVTLSNPEPVLSVRTK
jgi:Siphovirus Gp157